MYLNAKPKALGMNGVQFGTGEAVTIFTGSEISSNTENTVIREDTATSTRVSI